MTEYLIALAIGAYLCTAGFSASIEVKALLIIAAAIFTLSGRTAELRPKAIVKRIIRTDCGPKDKKV